ncbi:MAG TPA: metalloregulator ArsR/SmtB family transcription factor [Kiloniellaceae bacterium]|nr:metalloregulator ArsR/SmtB family transcription factor [Kiloniellaceae bacterium]
MDRLLHGLRAAAEQTRLRILGLCAHGDLAVTELVEILGQSQPRVSRHLKILIEAGLLERHQEGSWAYFRIAEQDGSGQLARLIVDLMPEDDPQHTLDLARLDALKEAYAVKAAAYFRKHAADWSRVRALHVDQEKLDGALRQIFAERGGGELLDIGTGDGHVLEVLQDRIDAGIGIDRSRDMLNVARSRLFRAGLRHCQVRQAEMAQLPFAADRFDAITLQMVLHYAHDPAAAIQEAARVLKPGGSLVVVDFIPHDRRELREEQAHRWLGFGDSTVAGFFHDAGLKARPPKRLEGTPLTVALWAADKPANDRQSTPQGKESRA